jgi:DNA-binding response OmpR family regulator
MVIAYFFLPKNHFRRTARGERVENEMTNYNRTNIIIVDNDPNELKALVIGLKLEGFDAVGVSDGHAALEILREEKFSIALIDLMMPRINGLQLAREIRKISPFTKTILMSAYTLSPVQLHRIDTGVVGYVTKPFQFDELVQFINNRSQPPKSPNSQSLTQREQRLRGVRAHTATNGLHLPVDIS